MEIYFVFTYLFIKNIHIYFQINMKLGGEEI